MTERYCLAVNEDVQRLLAIDFKEIDMDGLPDDEYIRKAKKSLYPTNDISRSFITILHVVKDRKAIDKFLPLILRMNKRKLCLGVQLFINENINRIPHLYGNTYKKIQMIDGRLLCLDK